MWTDPSVSLLLLLPLEKEKKTIKTNPLDKKEIHFKKFFISQENFLDYSAQKGNTMQS